MALQVLLEKFGWAVLAACFFPVAAGGAEIIDTWASYKNGTLLLRSEILVHVPAGQVREILTDYENLPKLSKDLKRVKVLERFDDGRVRMRADSEICILAFCLDFAWMQDTRVLPNGDITVNILPRKGDFRRGNGRWTLLEEADNTRLTFDIDLIPAFWLPPVFGPWYIKRKLFNEVFQTSLGIEKVAAQKVYLPNPKKR
ncbi:MAG: type II toxin-antitoxin system RatA family toxin [Gammaproteobacteria bacterium]